MLETDNNLSKTFRKSKNSTSQGWKTIGADTLDMARQTPNPSVSALADTPLTPDDVLAVNADFKNFTRSNDRIYEFIRRAYATASALKDLKISFETEVDQKIRQSSRGTPSNLSPEVAASFLAPEQLTRLFDSFMQQKLAAVESIKHSTQSKERQVDAVVNTLRSTLNDLLTDDQISDEVRQKFAQALDAAVEVAARGGTLVEESARATRIGEQS